MFFFYGLLKDLFADEKIVNIFPFSLLQKDEVYLNLVLEYIPETVYKVARQYAKNKQTIPINFIRVSGKFNSELYRLIHLLLYFSLVALYVPIVPKSRIHPLVGHLSPRHQTAEFAAGPGFGCAEIM